VRAKVIIGATCITKNPLNGFSGLAKKFISVTITIKMKVYNSAYIRETLLNFIDSKYRITDRIIRAKLRTTNPIKLKSAPLTYL
jgi:hypothetical protein